MTGEMTPGDTECSTCGCNFNLNCEGGIAGDFGIVPIAFCQTCFESCIDMVRQMYPCGGCGNQCNKGGKCC